MSSSSSFTWCSIPGLEGVEGGAEAGLVGGEGDEVLNDLAGQVMLGLALLHVVALEDWLQRQVHRGLLELHVRLEGALTSSSMNGGPLGALGVLDLLEQVLDVSMVGFEDAG